MPFLESLFDLPYRITGRQVVGVGLGLWVVSAFISGTGCHLPSPYTWSMMPTRVQIASVPTDPAFIVGMPSSLTRVHADVAAWFSVKECTPANADQGRELWRVTELRPGETWPRPKWWGRFVRDTTWFAFRYGDVPKGWVASDAPSPLREGVPYVATLRLDRYYGGRVTFIVEHGQLRYGRTGSWANTVEECAVELRPEGVWRRG